MSYRGDVRLGATVHLKFSTVNTSAVPTTLAGGTVAAYPDSSTTEITAGLTLTTDFDGRTGLHHLAIVATSGNGYLTATDYDLVLTAGTVGGTSVVGMVVGSFSIEARSDLMATVAGRTLDVSAGGEAGVDWANVGSPTTSNALTNTSIASVSGAVGSVTGSVGSVTGAVGSVTGNVGGTVTGSVGSVVGNVGGNVVGSVGSVVGDTKQTGDAFLRLGAPAGASVSADIAAVKADTAGIAAKTVNLPPDPADASDIATATTNIANAVAAVKVDTAAIKTDTTALGVSVANVPGGVWATTLETGFTALQLMRLIVSACAGKLSGAATTTITIRNPQDTKSRIVATVDASGNRSATTYDVT